MAASDLKLQWMADELRAHGLPVVEHTGWKTRTASKPYSYRPVGVLNHHTAGSSILVNYPDPPYWSDSRLEYSCNITIPPDATVHVLNAGIANDSGMGDPAVLNRLLRDEEPTVPLDRYESQRVTGNPWFIDIEVQHRGDGGPIDPAQYRALIRTNAVLMSHYGWNPMTRILMHRDWTLRKIDPRWSGFSNPGYTIRTHTKEEMEEEMAQFTEAEAAQLRALLPWADDTLRKLHDTFTAKRADVGGVTARMIDLVRNSGGLATEAEVKKMIAAAVEGISAGGGMSEADVRRVIAEAIANG